MYLKTLITLIAILIAVSALAVDITLPNVPAETVAAIKHKCDKTKPDIVDGEGNATPDPCTNAEAMAFGESLLWDALTPVVNTYKREKQAAAGIDRDYLRTLADDENFTHAQKCARFDADGLKAKYEAYVEVACP